MKFIFEQTVPAQIYDVFKFFVQPSHLSTLMRDRPTFRLLRDDGSVRPGCCTWIEETVAGCVPVVMGFLHTDYEPPYRFGEHLIHGPFSRFHHVHEFEDRGSETLVRDRLDVRLPGKFAGETVMRTAIAPVIRRVFQLRHRTLQELSEARW